MSTTLEGAPNMVDTVRIVSDGTSMGTHIHVDGKPLEENVLITKVTCSIESGGLSQVTLHTDYVATDITITNGQPTLDQVRALHKPAHLAGEIPGWGPHCHTCRDSTSGAANWPCATARLVYTQDEITALQQSA